MTITNLNPYSTQQSQPNLSQIISRQTLIDLGLNYLHEVGAQHICKVCIYNSGSCCNGCQYLKDRVGCQLRNTSCTAWLCGFLKYMLYETGHLQEWFDFWEQVPGQDHRMDFTPEQVFIRKSLPTHHLSELSLALAADLQQIFQGNTTSGSIVTLREKLDANIDLILLYNKEPIKQQKWKKDLQRCTAPFQQFQLALREYRNG